jgi:hypothetical protein
MQTRIRFVAMALALFCTAVAADAAQSGAKDDKKKEGTTVSGTAKATGAAVGDAAKTTGKKSKTVAKKTGSTTKKGAKKTGSTAKKGAEKTAGGAKKLGTGIKHTVTGDDKDKKS